MPDLEIREFEVRKLDHEERTITGVAVPWDVDASIGGWYNERFERGSVEDDGALLFYGHTDPIGKVIESHDTDEGREITARISKTERGEEAYTLARDGVLTKLSIGFEPLEHREDDETNTIIRTRVRAREYSLVPIPAYDDAKVTAVRSEQPKTSSQVREVDKQGADMPQENADLVEVRNMVEDLDRRMQTFQAPVAEPVIDTRSAGQVLKDIVAGDQATIDGYEALRRNYDPNVIASAVVKPAWVGDLTRIFDSSSGVLASTFSTGTLPGSGMSIEFAELATNTIDVAAQATEHTAIEMGNVSITTRTAPVATYAGGTTLSRQAIERATVGILNTSLEAMATAAGARKNAVLRAAFDALVTARKAIADDAGVVKLGDTGTAKKISTATAGDWENTLVNAAVLFDAMALPLEVLIVNGLVFKHLRGLTVSGERVFQTWKDNASGELNLPGLRGQMAGIPVLLDSGVANTAGHAVFANGRAIRQYDSGLVSLSDENILTLAKTFAVYRYGAVAAEIPGAVLPVKITAE